MDCSYILDRECYVVIDSHVSDSLKSASGIPQGSVLGPLFLSLSLPLSLSLSLYVAPIAQIFSEYGIKFHQYADDTQLYTIVNSTDISNFEALRNCVRTATKWFLANDLLLNADKTELYSLGLGNNSRNTWTTKLRRQYGQDSRRPARFDTIAGSVVPQVDSIVRSCNYIPRTFTAPHSEVPDSRRRSHEDDRFRSSDFRLDYCNPLLFNTSKSNIFKLQYIQNYRGSDARPLLNQLH